MSGKFNIAGPVKEFTAMDMEPSIPMLPMCSRTDLDRALMECDNEKRGRLVPDSRSEPVDFTVDPETRGVFSVWGAISRCLSRKQRE